jgi:ABC-type amino acid transport substrate-binding protein
MGTELRYGGDRNFAPFEALDERGRPAGFLTELLGLLGPKLERTITINLDEWSRTEERFRAGEIDMVAMVALDERRLWAQFSRPIAALQIAVFLPQSAIEPQGAPDLATLRLAVHKSAPMPETIARFLPMIGAPVFASENASEVLQAVADGRADAALMVKAYGIPALKAYGSSLKMSALALNLQTYAFAVRPGNLDLVEALDLALEALEKDGSLEALRRKWLPSHQVPAMREQLDSARVELRQRTVLGGLTATVVCAGLAGLWLINRRQAQMEFARRQSVQDKLVQTRKLLDTIFGEHPDGIVVVNPTTNSIIAANKSFHAWFPRQSWIGQAFSHWVSSLPEHSSSILGALQGEAGREWSFPLDLSSVAGAHKHLWALGKRLPPEEGSLLILVLRDFSGTVAQAPHLMQQLKSDFSQGIRLASSRGLLTQATLRAVKERTELAKGLSGVLDDRMRSMRLEEGKSISQSIQAALDRVSLVLSGLDEYAEIEMRPLQPVTVELQAGVDPLDRRDLLFA